MNDKIIAKINKLMALTTSSNENESSVAAQRAFELMEAYGITTQDLDMANLENDLGTIDDEVLDAKSQLMPWEKQLAGVISKYFDCVSYTQRKIHPKDWSRWTYAVGFIGHESNRITAITMYEWLRKAIWKEATQKYKGMGAYQRSFCIGVVNGINSKYNSNKPQEKQEVGLVVYDEVQNWIKNNMDLKEGSSRLPSVYSGAYASGRAASDNYSLNRQFGLKAIGCN